MAVFDGENGLSLSVGSVLRQEGVCLELVIVDDGSTDATPAILCELEAQDPRVRVIRQPNQGLTEALIRGCSEARGRFLARLDVGDVSAPLRLKKQKEALERDESVTFVSCWTEFVAQHGEVLFTDKGGQLPLDPVVLIDETKPWGVVGGPSSHSSVMMRADAYRAVSGYRSEFYFGQDWDLWYRLAEQGRFLMLHEPLCRNVFRPDGLSARWGREQMKLAKLSRAALMARLRGADETPILSQAAAIRPVNIRAQGDRASGLYFVGELLRRQGSEHARAYLREAIRERPAMLRAWVRWLQSFIRTAGR